MRLIIYLALAIFILGCETTGGIIFGLFPAPKFLEGEIKNNIYMGKDNLFSVSLPHKEGTYEFKYMQVKEIYTKNNAYISFGPAAFNKSIYRLEIAITPGSAINLEINADKVIASYSKLLHEQYTTPPIIQKRKKISVNNNKAIYFELRQNIPIGRHWSSVETIFTHYAYVINYNYGIAVAWVQIPEGASSKEEGISHSDYVKSVILMTDKFSGPRK